MWIQLCFGCRPGCMFVSLCVFCFVTLYLLLATTAAATAALSVETRFYVRVTSSSRPAATMSTGTLKKPSRPPPPPPTDPESYHNSFNSSTSTHHPSNSSSSSSSVATFGGHKKSTSRISDYIKISECHTGLPDKHQQQHQLALGGHPFDHKYSTTTSHGLAGFKSRTSTSFSSATLKHSTNLFSLGTTSPLTSHNQFPPDHHHNHRSTYQTSHQKSRSLTENHLNQSFCDLPPYEAQHNSSRGNKHHSSTRYSNNISVNNNHHHDSKTLCAGKSYFKHQQVDNRKSSMTPPTTVYKTVDFVRTEALAKCQVERTSGRGSDFNRLLVSSNQRKS